MPELSGPEIPGPELSGPELSAPESHAMLCGRGVPIAERSVAHLPDRHDEGLATRLGDADHLRRRSGRGRVVLALDGLQPDLGHEVLWVLRDGLSGTVLPARSLLPGTAEDLAVSLREAVEAVGVPVARVIGDAQRSIRKAVAEALPGVPHRLCQLHFLREAALPAFEADRHVKKPARREGVEGPARGAPDRAGDGGPVRCRG